MKSRSTTGTAAPRVTRAIRGILREGDDEHDQPRLRPDRCQRHERKEQLREGEADVHQAHQDVVDAAAAVCGDEADRDAEQERERGGQGGEHEDGVAAIQEPESTSWPK